MRLSEMRDDGCRWWLGTVNPVSGYGQFTPVYGERIHYAHRIAYREFVGEIPEGMVLDHLCNNRLCINYEHLQPVTHSENLRRSPRTQASKNAAKTECPLGHPLDGEQKAKNGNTWRYCKTCKREQRRRWYHSKVRRENEALNPTLCEVCDDPLGTGEDCYVCLFYAKLGITPAQAVQVMDADPNADPVFRDAMASLVEYIEDDLSEVN